MIFFFGFFKYNIFWVGEAEIFYLDTFLGNIGGFQNGCN